MKPVTILILAALAACSSKNPGSYTTATAAAAADVDPDDALERADALWAERVEPDKLKASLDAYAQVVAADPTHRRALQRLARGWYFYGDAHTTDKDVAIERWGQAVTYGKQCLALNKDFASRVTGGEKEKDAVSSTVKDDVPCLYWTASAIGKWARAQGIAKALGNLPTVKAYIGRAEELDPTYFYYGPARYWGAYYAVLPSFAGQDLGKSAEYFDASIKGAPAYLATRGLRAENLAVKTQDLKLFLDDIQYILDFDVSAEPALTPENTLEKKRAEALLAKKGELFDKKTLEAYESAQ